MKALSWEKAQHIRAVVVQPKHALESIGEFVKRDCWLHTVSNSVSLGQGSGICTSSKFPSNADDAGLRNTL